MCSFPSPTNYLENCSYNIFQTLQLCLDTSRNWEFFGKSLHIIGKDLTQQEFHELEIQSQKVGGSPAQFLWLKLQSWLTTVQDLILILRHCNFLEPLSLLVEPEPIEIIIQPGDDEEEQVLEFGSTLNLICEAKSIPPPSGYQWFHDNNDILNQNKSKLQIDNLSSDHEGAYYCVISQTLSDKSVSKVISNYINIKVKDLFPVITHQSNELHAVHQGTNLMLRVYTNPPPEDLHINWYHNNKLLKDEHSSILFIEDTNFKNEGTYICEINNKTGTNYSKNMNLILLSSHHNNTDENNTLNNNDNKLNNYHIDEDSNNEEEKQASCKVALLIANDKYKYMQNLETPTNDINEIKIILENLNFTVFSLCNLTKLEMIQFIEEFCYMVPPKSYIFFYYVGHGFLMFDKYFMPIDILENNFLRSDCICDKQVMSLLLKIDPQLIIFVLDMCLVRPDRDINPKIYNEDIIFYEDYRFNLNNCNIFEAFATTSQSYERINQHLGIYANHLVKFLLKKNLTVSKIFLQAHADLIKHNEETNQRPLICVDAASQYKLSDSYILGVHEKVTELFSLYKTIKRSDFKVEFKKLNIKFGVHISDYQGCLNCLRVTFNTSYQLHCTSNCPDVLLEWIKNENGQSDLLVQHLQKVKEKFELKIYIYDVSCDVTPQQELLSQQPLDEYCLRLGRPLIVRAVNRPYKESKWKNYLSRIESQKS